MPSISVLEDEKETTTSKPLIEIIGDAPMAAKSSPPSDTFLSESEAQEQTNKPKRTDDPEQQVTESAMQEAVHKAKDESAKQQDETLGKETFLICNSHLL